MILFLSTKISNKYHKIIQKMIGYPSRITQSIV